MSPETALKTIMMALIALAALGGAVAILLPYRKFARQSRESQAWPETLGEVVASEVRSKSVMTSQQISRRVYRPNIVYRYAVAGQPYESSRLIHAERYFNGSQTWARNIAKRFPVGSQVRVYYDPAQPAYAVLDRKSAYTRGKLNTYLLLLIVPCGAALAAAVLVLR